MRLMLILVLICSLFQSATADETASILVDGCETVYKCYVPQHCVFPGTSSMDNSAVIQLSRTFPIIPSCKALIKFHAYADNWIHVTIESRDPTTKSVVFTQYTNNPRAEKNVFSCKQNDALNQLEGWHMSKLKKIHKPLPSPIKCEFEVKLSRLPKGQKVLLFSSDDIALFTIDGIPTKADEPAPYLDLPTKCNPSRLEYNSLQQEKTRVYDKVQYSPGNYFCNNAAIFKMQHLEDGKSTPTENVQLTCGASGKFQVGSNEYEFLDIRCVADAKYFCDYKVKETGKSLLDQKSPNKVTGEAGHLKCPAGHHLFVSGKPMLGASIECINYGGNPRWTVGTQQLDVKGPEVFCSQEIACNLLYNIPESHVKGGTVDNNHLPKCFGTGVLQDANKQPTSVRCDTATGEYKYTIGAEEKTVLNTTQFSCYHAPVYDPKVDQKNARKIQYGIMGAGIGSGIVAFLTIVFMIWFARMKIRKDRKRREALDDAQYMKFAMNKKERRKEVKKREAQKVVQKTAPSSSSAQPNNTNVYLNDMQWSAQYEGLRVISAGEMTAVDEEKREIIRRLPKVQGNGVGKKAEAEKMGPKTAACPKMARVYNPKYAKSKKNGFKRNEEQE